MTDTEIKNIVTNKVKELSLKFSKEFNVDVKYDKITFDVTGKKAGIFSYGGYLEVGFNMVLLRDNLDAFLRRTVPHEVAHLCSHIKYGVLRDRVGRRRVHGKEWKAINKFLGGEGSRCHTYNCDKVSVRRHRRWSYICDCGHDHQIATVTHNKIRRGLGSYSCRLCGSKIIYNG